MSQQNVEIIRNMYAAWLSTGFEAAFETFDADIELNPDPEAFWVGIGEVYRGHAGVRSYMAAVADAFADYRPEIEDFVDCGDQVVTLAIESGRGRESGATVQSNRTAHVWTLRDGKAVRIDLYLDRAAALKAVGLEQ